MRIVIGLLVIAICTGSLPLRVLSQPGCRNNLVTVYIDGDNGNDSSCIPPGGKNLPCKTLTHALNSHRGNCVSYVIMSPRATLGPVLSFFQLQDISFVGTNGSAVVCSDDTGLAFYNVSNLSFQDISFLYCGALRNSTSKEYGSRGRTNFSLLQFRAALYIDRCSNVSMNSVTVKSSRNATGVAMYNTGGVNNIHNCKFSDNRVFEGLPGGGGFYIEFTYCLPGDIACVNGKEYVKMRNVQYVLTSSTFSDNAASSGEGKSRATYIIPFETNHHAFGRGGGLSIFVKGTAAYNSFHVSNCTFLRNKAEWGGGSFIEFHDNAGSNEVIYHNCTFEHNFCEYELTRGTGGGGLRIGHYVYGINGSKQYEGGNHIEVMGCHFRFNYAMYGGGISISPTLQSFSNYSLGMESLVLVEDSTFYNNTAMMGAAINIIKFALISGNVMLRMVLRSITVDSNLAFYANIIDKDNTPHTEGVGALYIQQVFTVFQGYSEFLANSHSGIAVVGTTVDFTNSYTVFRENHGYRGGGISLLGMAYLLISDNTRMMFDSNVVRNSGGAIHNRYVEMDNLKTRSNCFIKHLDPFRQPNDWGASFVFQNNTIRRHEDNAIHSSSILPCAWAGGNGFNTEITDIFCWNNWTYLDQLNRVANCMDQVSSDAGNVTFDVFREANEEVHVDAIPGWDFNLPLNIEDDYSDEMNSTIVFALIREDSNNVNPSYIWGNKANLKGEENSSNKINLESLGDRIWEVNVIVDLHPCPLGFVLSERGTCQCPNGSYGGILECDSGTKTIVLNDNDIWLGTLDNTSSYYIGLCPPGFCNSSDIIHDNNCSNCTTNICSRNRQGVMCGQCIDGYGPAVNSRNYDCTECTARSLAANLPQYIAAVYIPLTLLFIILICFDIRLTTGPANAFILYCQAISSTFGLGVGVVPLNNKITTVPILDKMYQFLYGIFNLEFFENLAKPWCLQQSFDTLSVLSLDYGVAIYPLLMIFAALLYQRFKEGLCRCSCVSRFSCEVLRRNSTLGEALLPAFATFILLSYNKFGLTSSYILAVGPLIADDGSTYSSHIYYAGQYTTDSSGYKYYFIPSVIAFGFVCVIPVLLLVYPLKLTEWCFRKVPSLWKYYPVDKIHFFLDTFQGCYKTKMRFFAGLYFLFRLLINSAYLGTVSWADQFIIQQVGCIVMVSLLAVCRPYTKEYNFLNYVDILIFVNLSVINALSFYLFVAVINGQNPSPTAAVIQYILVFLPLIYMTGYLVYLVVKRQRCFKNYISAYRRERRVRMPSRATISQIFTTEAPPSDEEDHDDDIFQRAENKNQYKKIEEDRGAAVNNSERNSSRPSGSTNRLSNVTQSNESAQRLSSGYGSCQKTHTQSSVEL